MIRLVLTIISLVLKIFSERGKTAPARKEQREDKKIKKAFVKDDLTTVSHLLRLKFKRMLASKGSGSA
jgi:hypothetical protein